MDYIVKERSPFEMLLDAELTDAQMLDKSIFFIGDHIDLHAISPKFVANN